MPKVKSIESSGKAFWPKMRWMKDISPLHWCQVWQRLLSNLAWYFHLPSHPTSCFSKDMILTDSPLFEMRRKFGWEQETTGNFHLCALKFSILGEKKLLRYNFSALALYDFGELFLYSCKEQIEETTNRHVRINTDCLRHFYQSSVEIYTILEKP